MLEQLAGKVPASGLPLVIEWLTTESTVRVLLDEINEGAGRISEIVKALKSYIYLDQAPAQTVDVHDGIENTLVILRYKLKKGIEVRREFAQHLPRIDAYGSELNQVWTNLIDNAIDAMQGKGKLTIRTRYQEPWVIVEVEDDGPGIPAEIQSRIFNPFFTTKPVGQGTGLGLNLSYNIIQKHRGEIKVHSRPGQTCFEVWLPVSQNAVR
jgi:signal transduction histidine kinase